MDNKQAKMLVISVVKNVAGDNIEVGLETPLVGAGSILDSMNLVEICLALEDASEEHDFQFDWTSESTMSKSRSMFRNVASLAQEFADQSSTKL
jgi:acyl carrier protein